jgi:hypothetical protein
MGETTQRLLRLLGFLLFIAGAAGIVLLFKPGPGEIADWMGNSCDHDSRDLASGGGCTAFDVVLILISAPIFVHIGGVMTLALGPAREGGPRTIDLSGFRRG